MNANLLFISKSSRKTNYSSFTHTHNYHEIIFYDAGCHGINIIDGIEYEFKPGDISVKKSGVPHSGTHLASGKLISLGFESNDPDVNIESGIYRDLWDTKIILDIMIKEVINQNYKYNDMIACKIKELLICIERTKNCASSNVKDLIYSKNYIEKNYMQPISIYDLSKFTGYSHSHFRHLFTQRFGISPQNYLIDIRCQKAVELIKNTSLSCTEIAYQCGFSDSGQLTKMLKNKYSTTPTKIRKEK